MNTLEFLRTNEHKSSNDFVSKAQYLKDNWGWLKYSYAVAIKVRHRMRDLGITQKELSKIMDCTQQHVSVLLSGQSNMTLETLAKLEQALKMDLIGSSLDEFRYLASSEPASAYLHDSTGSENSLQGIKTSTLVEGYKPRKKKGPKAL